MRFFFALFRNDVDRAAYGTGSVANGTAALDDLNFGNRINSRQGSQIHRAPPVRRTLGIAYVLSVHENVDTVVAVQFYEGCSAGNHTVNDDAVYLPQYVFHGFVIVGADFLLRKDGRLRIRQISLFAVIGIDYNRPCSHANNIVVTRLHGPGTGADADQDRVYACPY